MLLAPLFLASVATAHLLSKGVLPRQTLTSSDVPAACDSVCSSTATIYEACEENDTTTCATICTDTAFNSLLSCFNCVLEAEGTTLIGYNSIVDIIAELDALCMSDDVPVTPTASLIPYESLTVTSGTSATAILGTATSLSLDFSTAETSTSESAQASASAAASATVTSASVAASTSASAAASSSTGFTISAASATVTSASVAASTSASAAASSSTGFTISAASATVSVEATTIGIMFATCVFALASGIWTNF